MIEKITETTVAFLGAHRAGMGNMVQDEYDLPGGKRRKGLTCVVDVFGVGQHTVGLGSVISLDGTQYEVVGIQKTDPRLGSVTIRQLGADQVPTVAEHGFRMPADALDWKFSTSCPRCGEAMGWTGDTEDVWGDVALVMACPYCANQTNWSKGALQAQLKARLPAFVPGRR